MTPREERLHELLAGRVVGGLGAHESRELDALLGDVPDAPDTEDYERAAAELHIALLPPLEPMPAALHARLSALAREFRAPGRQD